MSFLDALTSAASSILSAVHLTETATIYRQVAGTQSETLAPNLTRTTIASGVRCAVATPSTKSDVEESRRADRLELRQHLICYLDTSVRITQDDEIEITAGGRTKVYQVLGPDEYQPDPVLQAVRVILRDSDNTAS